MPLDQGEGDSVATVESVEDGEAVGALRHLSCPVQKRRGISNDSLEKGPVILQSARCAWLHIAHDLAATHMLRHP